MSCNLIDKNVIDYLVYNFLSHKITTKLDPDDLGILLIRENEKSWEYRYNEGANKKFAINNYKYNKYVKYDSDHMQLIKTIEYYCYQSCEHPEWRSSDIKENLYALMRSAIDKLTYAEKMKKIWGAPKPLGGISS